MSDDKPLPPKICQLIIMLVIFCMAWKYQPPSWAVEQVESWRPLVREVIQEKKRHPKLTQELVLSIIAQESYGNRYALSHKGARGLMQVMCFDWMNINCDVLYTPKINVQWGVWFLNEGLEMCQPINANVTRCALKIYNCGTDVLRCGRFYADKVLEYWMPNFRSWYPSWRGKMLTE